MFMIFVDMTIHSQRIIYIYIYNINTLVDKFTHKPLVNTIAGPIVNLLINTRLYIDIVEVTLRFGHQIMVVIEGTSFSCRPTGVWEVIPQTFLTNRLTRLPNFYTSLPGKHFVYNLTSQAIEASARKTGITNFSEDASLGLLVFDCNIKDTILLNTMCSTTLFHIKQKCIVGSSW